MKTEEDSEHVVLFSEREDGPTCGLDEEMIRQAGGTIRYGKAANEKERIQMAESA